MYGRRMRLVHGQKLSTLIDIPKTNHSWPSTHWCNYTQNRMFQTFYFVRQVTKVIWIVFTARRYADCRARFWQIRFFSDHLSLCLADVYAVSQKTCQNFWLCICFWDSVNCDKTKNCTYFDTMWNVWATFIGEWFSKVQWSISGLIFNRLSLALTVVDGERRFQPKVAHSHLKMQTVTDLRS